jgi:deazaflavin-dependent oxidoreductase (nitroreductase family)
MGFNGLITIRGRKSGLPRTTPVAIIEVSGRRWIWAPWGEVHWVRNLRAARRATITVRRRKEEVSATELDATERVGFFRDVLGPLARSIPGGVTFVRVADQVDLDDPVGAAEGRRVFELHPFDDVRSTVFGAGVLKGRGDIPFVVNTSALHGRPIAANPLIRALRIDAFPT